MTYAGGGSSLFKLFAGAVVGFMVALPAAILAVRAYNAPAAYAAALYRDGFNFDVFRGENYYRSSLTSGGRIDTTRFRAEDGADLRGAIGEQDEVIMLLAYDPRCSFCKKADVEIDRVSRSMSAAGIRYFFASFSRSISPPVFHRAAKAYGVPSFAWEGDERDANFSFDMNTPSHILMTRDGVVLRVWPGALDEPEAQERMATQIAADTHAILDALRALKSQAAGAAPAQAGLSRPAPEAR